MAISGQVELPRWPPKKLVFLSIRTKELTSGIQELADLSYFRGP